MAVSAKAVIGYVSGIMGISDDDAQKALCITDKGMVIELQNAADKNRYEHVVAHDLDTGKVDLEKIAGTLGSRQAQRRRTAVHIAPGIYFSTGIQ